MRPPPSSTTTAPTLRLAPHMRAKDGEGGDDAPLMSFLKGNPLLFAVVIFPTLTMGVLLLARPRLRPAFLGGSGDGGGGIGGGGMSGGSARDGVDDVPREAPAYDDEVEGRGRGEIVVRALSTTTECDGDRGGEEGNPSMSSSLLGRWRDVVTMRRRHLGGETSADPSPALGKDDDG